MTNIAKLTSYGCYLDCDFVTAKYPDDEVHIVGNVAEYVYDLEQKISDLEAKLAEKDSEIEQWKSMAERSSNLLDRFNRTGEIETQDKISFALEQLEKVKEYIEKDKDWEVFAIAGLIKNQIDNQIKQLKEMK